MEKLYVIVSVPMSLRKTSRNVSENSSDHQRIKRSNDSDYHRFCKIERVSGRISVGGKGSVRRRYTEIRLAS